MQGRLCDQFTSNRTDFKQLRYRRKSEFLNKKTTLCDRQ